MALSHASVGALTFLVDLVVETNPMINRMPWALVKVPAGKQQREFASHGAFASVQNNDLNR